MASKLGIKSYGFAARAFNRLCYGVFDNRADTADVRL
jgi:hypothetical protein